MIELSCTRTFSFSFYPFSPEPHRRDPHNLPLPLLHRHLIKDTKKLIKMCLRASAKCSATAATASPATQGFYQCHLPMYHPCRYPSILPKSHPIFAELCERRKIEARQVKAAALERALFLLAGGWLRGWGLSLSTYYSEES